MHKKKKRKSIPYREIELNIMPFIDVFSLLNIFLLYSAVFVSVGIIEVQIPFFTNAPPQKTERTRDFEVKVDVMPDKIELITSWSMAPVDEKKENFPLSEEGVQALHKKLVSLRLQNKETDKVTVFSEDEIPYEKLTMVLDSIKFLQADDPKIEQVVDPNSKETRETSFLYPKIVLGSVIL